MALQQHEAAWEKRQCEDSEADSELFFLSAKCYILSPFLSKNNIDIFLFVPICLDGGEVWYLLPPPFFFKSEL